MDSNHAPDASVRRSRRVPVQTSISKEYMAEVTAARNPIPYEGDGISVKWILSGEEIWWPATVLSVDPHTNRSRSCRGVLLYHKLKHYQTERANVEFSYVQKSGERLVSTTIGREQSHMRKEGSSWIYIDENVTDDGKYQSGSSSSQSQLNIINTDRTSDTQIPLPTIITAPILADNTDHIDVNFERHDERHKSKRSSSRTLSLNNEKAVSLTPRKEITRSRQRRNSSTAPHLKVAPTSPDNSSIVNVAMKGAISVPAGDNGNDLPNSPSLIKKEDKLQSENRNNTNEHISMDRIEMRMYLMERNLANVMKDKELSLPSSTEAVLVALRWSFLRILEKPLKPLQIPDLTKYGIASNVVTAKCECDYNGFKDITSYLGRVYASSTASNRDSRVVFSPSYSTVQSGSFAVKDMRVIFSTLADICSLLGVREEEDYEKMLSKEVQSESTSLLRLVGTFRVLDSNSTSPNDSTLQIEDHTATSSQSANATSSSSSCIQVFLGTAPVVHNVEKDENLKIVKAEDTKPSAGNQSHHHELDLETEFRSVVFEQKCDHFSISKMCFQTKWMVKHISSKLNVTCRFDPDGGISCGKLSDHIVLKWSRQPAPSNTKWTSDIQYTAGNSPGTLHLSIPTLFMTARHNVEAVSYILDEWVETFMTQYSMIRS